MKILFYFVTLIVLVNTKEKLSGLEQYFQDPRFWQFVEKRLDSKNEVKSKVSDVPDESPSKPKDQYDPINTHSEGDNSEENVQSDKHQADLMEDTLGNLCQYRPNASLIIRSKASINNGAFFLKSFNKKTREECVNACCYTQGCNLIVYENKAEHNCYLFNCGTPSKCLFAEHANYTSMFFPNHAAPSSSSTGHQQQHENELEGLNSKETPKPTTNAPRKNVALYGRCDIDWNEECSDRNAECRDGICKCSYGYHAKYGICRVDCPDSAFECENKGQGFSVPECISKDHVCDGQPQCADGSDEETCAPPPSAMTTTTTTTTTTAKPTTLKAVQPILSRQGVNDQILPQYFPSNVNRLPVGSDTSMYNGNAYYWPSGYNPSYGTQNAPQNYGRFQPGGVQYPYDPRFYNSYDSNGRLIGTNNGYPNPVQDYYGKSATGSKNHAASSKADLGTGIPKGSKPYSGERYINRKVAPVPQGRDGAPVLSKQVASGQDHILKSTSMPTTVHSTLQSVSTKGSSNKWKSQNQQTDWNQPDQTGWKSSSIKNSKNHFQNDVPSWKSDDKTQDLAPDSQNEWEKTPNSAHDKMDQTNNKLEPNESEQQTSSDSMSSPHSDKNSQLETGNQEVPVPHRDAAPERTWKQHTEYNMGNPNLGSETNMQKNAEDAGKGRIHVNEDSRVQGNTDSAESQGRKGSINQDGGQSGKLNELQGWTESTNRGNGQTGTNHKQQNSMASGIQSQGRSRGRSKGRISGAYHRKQGIKDRNQMADKSSKLHKQKQKEVQQNTGYDNYLNKNPLGDQRKTSGHRRPLHRYDGSRYPFYDSPYSYWNYDYYNYDDPSKKYPSPVNQEDTDYKDSMVDEEGKNVPYDTTPKPTHRPSPRPRPTTPAKTTLAPDSSANKDKDPDQKTSIKEKDPDLQTADNKPAQPSPKTDKTLTPSSKNSTAQNVPDSSGLGGEVVESHVVVESPTDSHQGPIVALGLGLGITVILLFFVGCRLRNVKRRIRKGRALHSNEADYLINGMYL